MLSAAGVDARWFDDRRLTTDLVDGRSSTSRRGVYYVFFIDARDSGRLSFGRSLTGARSESERHQSGLLQFSNEEK